MTFDIIGGDDLDSLESSSTCRTPLGSFPRTCGPSIVLDDVALERELDAMTDSFTDVVATQVANRAAERPWLFVNRLSRLVVDPERFPDEREEMNTVGMGAVYTRTSTGDVLRDGSVDDFSGLVDRFFTPYSRAFADLVDQRLAATGHVTIIDLHSYPLEPLPYELHDGPRPEVCLGTDPFHTPADLRDQALHSFSDFTLGFDSPFAGCYVPLTHHGVNRSVHALMIELRRDLFLDDTHALVGPALEPVVSSIARLVGDLRCNAAAPPGDLAHRGAANSEPECDDSRRLPIDATAR